MQRSRAVDRGRDQIKPSAEPKTVLLQGGRSNEPTRHITVAECPSPCRRQMQMITQQTNTNLCGMKKRNLTLVFYTVLGSVRSCVTLVQDRRPLPDLIREALEKPPAHRQATSCTQQHESKVLPTE